MSDNSYKTKETITPVLSVRDFSVGFTQYTKGLHKRVNKTIQNLSIDVNDSEIVAIVGSSGSGKSLLADGIFGILPYNAHCSGSTVFMGKELTFEDKKRLRGKEMALIPQSVNYLDPLLRVEDQIKISVPPEKKDRADEIVEELFKKYNLMPAVKKYYPFELSGGMARKVLLATALAGNAKLIVADEPTPGLDEQALNEVLSDFKVLTDNGCAVLMITHDINAALKIADRVAIFYAGSTIEVANKSDFEGDGSGLRHPYSRALLHAMPSRAFEPIPGFQPFPCDDHRGCMFYDRCPERHDDCREKDVPMREIRNGEVRCLYAT